MFVVSGDATMARETVYTSLGNQGFTVTQTGPWSAHAERGSKGGSIALGALAGKSGRHVVLDIACQATPDGNLAISLAQGASGMSGGVIGMQQAKSIYEGVYNAVGATFQNAGVLVSATGI